MAEFVERGRLKEAISADCQHLFSFDSSLYELFMIDIDEIPAADVAPIVHGRWIEKSGDLYCSECGHQIPDCAGNATVIFASDNRFCYYCGAKMDGQKIN